MANHESNPSKIRSAAEMLAEVPRSRAYEVQGNPRKLAKLREVLREDSKQMSREELERGYVHYALMLVQADAHIDQRDDAETANSVQISARSRKAADARHASNRRKKAAVIHEFRARKFSSKDRAAEVLAPEFGISVRTAREYLKGT